MPNFPELLRTLPKFNGPFDAFRLSAEDCDVLFASYPDGTAIPRSAALRGVGPQVTGRTE